MNDNWRESRKGNYFSWSESEDAFVTVYRTSHGDWNYVCNGTFGPGNYPNWDDAAEDTESHFSPVGFRKKNKAQDDFSDM